MPYGIRRVVRNGVEYHYLIEQSERTVRPLTSIEASQVRELPRDMFERWARTVDNVPANTLEAAADTIRRVRK